MPFSTEWDDKYKKNEHMSVWPWTHLVSYVMRYCRPLVENYKVLELGCGVGANISFFKSLGVDYYGIDGSPSAVEHITKTHPDLKNKVICADFTSEIPFKENFDLIFDRSALTHNIKSDIIKTIDIITPLINTHGKYIGIDWFSINNTYFKHGCPVEKDPQARTKFHEGPYTDVGIVRFTAEQDLKEWFHAYNILKIEEVTTRQLLPQSDILYSTLNFICEKK